MTPAQMAAIEYQRRRDWLSRAIAEHKLSPADAEAKLRPWLAIAAMAGADLPELFDEHATIFPYETAGQTVREPTAIDKICPRPQALAALGAARNAAIDALDEHRAGDPAAARRKVETARRLATLAMVLGAPPYRQQERREAA